MRKWICVLLILPTSALAGVGKVYEPYVNALEQEVEYRTLYDDGNSGDPRHSLKQVAGYSFGIADGLAVEISGSRYSITDGANEFRSSEVEVFWQLTEQGEYDSDWGVAFALERNHINNYWETSSKLLFAHDFAQTSLILNAGLNYSWGSGVSNEYEAEVRGAYVWRYSQNFSPSFEFHTSESLTAIGPMLGGKYRLAPGKAIMWKAGVLLGLDHFSPNNALKFELEYEF
jgi:hypothetical protein